MPTQPIDFARERFDYDAEPPRRDRLAATHHMERCESIVDTHVECPLLVLMISGIYG